MSATELSLYTQITAGRMLWMGAYAGQLILRRLWAYCYLAYESQTKWRPTDKEMLEACSQTILCERARHHKRGCPGKTVRIEEYTRRITNA